MFKEGVKTLFYDGVKESRLYFSRGITKISGLNRAYNQEFHLNSYIPQEPWSSLTEEMSTLLVSKKESNFNFKEIISIIKIPSDVITLFKNLEFNKVKNYSCLEKIKRQNADEYFEAMFSLDQYIFKYLINDIKFDKLGVHVGKPNLFSATISKGKYVGLHIDYWDELTFDKIDDATNRISVNLGKEDRFLIFVNLTIKQMFNKLRQYTSKSIEQYDSNSIVDDFFHYFPNYPILKVRQKPYEAYIAPTENIIHDGCTLGSSSTDVTLTTRGYFKLYL